MSVSVVYPLEEVNVSYSDAELGLRVLFPVRIYNFKQCATVGQPRQGIRSGYYMQLLVMDRQLSFTGLYTGAEEDVVDGKKHQRHDTVDELEADAGAVAKRSY